MNFLLFLETLLLHFLMSLKVSYSLLNEWGKGHGKIGRILSIFKTYISIRKLGEEQDKPDKLSRARTTYMFDTAMKILPTIHNIMKVEFSFYLCLSYLSNLFFPLHFCYYPCYRTIKVCFLLNKSTWFIHYYIHPFWNRKLLCTCLVVKQKYRRSRRISSLFSRE